MLKKALILSIVIIALSTILVPFSLKADYFNIAPFVGINYYIEDYDNENRVSLNSGNTSVSLSGSQSNTLLVQRTSNGVTYVTSTYSQGGVSGNGGNISLSGTINLNSSISNTQIVYRVIHVTIVLDNNYIGYIRPKVNVPGNNTNLFQQDLSVNGSSVEFSFIDNNISTDIFNSYIITWNDFSLILNNNNERWHFPIESFNLLSYGLYTNPNRLIGFNKYNTYYMPIFGLKSGDNLFETWITDNKTYTFIFYSNKNMYNSSRFLNNFNINNLTIDRYYVDDNSRFYFNGSIMYYTKITFSSGSYNGRNTISILNDVDILPIYFNISDYDLISTDFALNFGLTNDLLDNLNIIANGNNSSNQSSSSADLTNQQASQTFAQEEQLVNNAENDLQSNLQSLDIQNQNNNLFGNSKFIASASWVKTQFDTLTNNNAFGYLITFSLVIGLSLVIIGKLRS